MTGPGAIDRSDSSPDSARLAEKLQRCLPRGERVAVLCPESGVAPQLERLGCGVLVLDGEETRALLAGGPVSRLDAFKPQAIVSIDALEDADRVRELRRAAPGAVLILAHWNASGAGSLLTGLAGRQARRPALAADALAEALAAAGFGEVRTEPLDAPAEPGLLAPDLEQRLRQLFEQLNPASTTERQLVVARDGASAPTESPPDSELLSVVVRNHRLDRLDLLDQAIFSLACQRHHPLEVIVVTQSPDDGAPARIEALLERHRAIGRFACRVLHEPAQADIRSRLLNRGIAAARGRYLAFLDDDDLIYPDHYLRLIASLRASRRAWAFARSRRVELTREAQGELYVRSKSDFFAGDRFDRASLIRDNYIALNSYVIDRTRLGRFALRFPESFSQLEDYVLLLQLAALFQPQFVSGPATCEYRIRDDGTNTVVDGGRADAAPAWQRAQELTDRIKRNVMMLVSEHEFTEANVPIALKSPHRELRYRVVDQLNAALKGAPLLHGALKALARLGRKVPRR